MGGKNLVLMPPLRLVKTATATAARPKAAARKPSAAKSVRSAAREKVVPVPQYGKEQGGLLKTGLFHWIFDATDVPKSVTLDPKLLDKVLRDVAKLCGMTIVSGPHAVKGIPSNPGYTAVCIVDFSHIGIHTFSNPLDVCVDIFSCKPFDPKIVHEYLLKAFRAKRETSIFFDVRYPYEYDRKNMPFQHCIAEPKGFTRSAK